MKKLQTSQTNTDDLTHRLSYPKTGSQLAFARFATAFAVFSVGALAVGALAIGALAIRRLAVGSGRFKRLAVEELDVGRLSVRELTVERGYEGHRPSFAERK